MGLGGDGMWHHLEECDDGNLNNEDGCSEVSCPFLYEKSIPNFSLQPHTDSAFDFLLKRRFHL